MEALQALWRDRSSRKGQEKLLLYHCQEATVDEVNVAVDRVVTALVQKGVSSGDGVAFVSSPKKAHQVVEIVVLLACIKLGAVWCPVQTKEQVVLSVAAVIEAVDEAICEGSISILLGASLRLIDTTATTNKYPIDALYCIGTSGTSSGQPRSVLGSATMTLRRLQWGWTQFSQVHFVLRRTPILFVDSIAELLGPLLSDTGQYLLLVHEAEKLKVDEKKWPSLLNCKGMLTATPSVLETMLLEEDQFKCLSVIISSGEPLSQSLRKKVAAKICKDSLLVNIYGSAEVSADVCYAILEPASRRRHCCDSCLAHPVSPIGSTLDDSIKIQIRSDDRLIVQGRSALGYVSSDKQLEAFSDTVATGDLGERCSICKAFKCLGRGDDIVNICGVKLRLAHLEASFSGVAVPRIDYEYPASSRIDIYRGATADPLPQEIPSYIRVRSLHGVTPRGPTGKMDKRAVRTRSVILEVFAELLHDDDNDTDDSFYARGGNSLTAIQALYYLQKIFPAAPIQIEDLSTAVSDLARRLTPFFLNRDAVMTSNLSNNTPDQDDATRLPFRKRRRVIEDNDFSIWSRDHDQPQAETLEEVSHQENLKEFTFRIAWSIDLGKCVDAPPLVIGENGKLRVYVGAHSKRFVCCDGHTGDIEWEAKVGNLGDQQRVLSDASIEAAACATRDRIYVGAYDCSMYCLSRTDGKMLWRHTVGAEIKNAARLGFFGRRLIFGAHDHAVYCLDAATGDRVWSAQNLGGAIFGTPHIIVHKDEEFVFFATTDPISPCAQCLHLSDGTFVWKHRLTAPAFAAPTCGRGRIFLGTVDGTVSAVNAMTGVSCWGFASSKRDAGIFAKALLCRNIVIFAANDGTVKARDDTKNGKLMWTFFASAPVFAAPARLHTDLILVAATDGTLDLIFLSSGCAAARIALNTALYSSPIPVYPFSAVPPSSCQENSNTATTSPVVASRIFVGARDDTLKAIDLCVSVVASST